MDSTVEKLQSEMKTVSALLETRNQELFKMQAALSSPQAAKYRTTKMTYRLASMLTLAGLLACLPVGEARAYMAYVSNEKDNTVTVVDLDKLVQLFQHYPELL